MEDPAVGAPGDGVEDDAGPVVVAVAVDSNGLVA